MYRAIATSLAILATAGLAWAHSGVKNPTVKARMDLMMQIGEATGSIVKMAKGELPFDAAAAQRAQQVLIEASGRISVAFEANETDPKSEALPVIWQDWAQFVAKSEAMAAAAASMQLDTLGNLRSSVPALGKSCGGCHEAFRKPSDN